MDLTEVYKRSKLSEAHHVNRRLSRLVHLQTRQLHEIQRKRAMNLDQTRLGTHAVLKQIEHCPSSQNPLAKKLEDRCLQRRREQTKLAKSAVVVKPKAVVIAPEPAKKASIFPSGSSNSRHRRRSTRKSLLGSLKGAEGGELRLRIDRFYTEMVINSNAAATHSIQDSEDDRDFRPSKTLTAKQWRQHLHRWRENGEFFGQTADSDDDSEDGEDAF